MRRQVVRDCPARLWSTLRPGGQMHSKSFVRAGLPAAFLWVAACGGGGSSTSPPPPAPTKSLSVATQPAGAQQASAFGTQPVVNVRLDGATNSADNTTVVTASLVAGTGTSGAHLTGTLTATATAGVATFTNLAVDLAGTNYQVAFNATGYPEVRSGSLSVSLPPGTVIPPGTPPASQVNFAIDSAQDVRPISRFVYGMNGWDPAQRPANLTLSRSGGNRMTAYDWETNDSNAGADYFNQNDNFLGGGTVPNGAVGPGIVAARNAGAGIVGTMPTIGHVSADHNGGGGVNLT